MTGPVVAELAEDPDGAVERVVEALLAGGVVVLPTDTVYGLVGLPGDAAAIGRIFDAKGRSADTPLAVLCADVGQASELVAPDHAGTLREMGDRWWPGPLTMVLPRRSGVDLHLGEPETTIGVRVPDDPLVQAVAARVGPVAATSANRHGEPTAVTAAEALLAVGHAVDLVVDGGSLAGRASTVIDATSTPWRVLREGPLPAAEISRQGEVPLL
ncbi:MAG: L-threonylcarbamoyladenylate synthase [Acidimicrobiales bacterium]|nr:L-threonylcarbamoyladenylate synthase [Acidimicrobiales bacterium]